MVTNTAFRRSIARYQQAVVGLPTLTQKGLRAATKKIEADMQRNYRKGRDPYGKKWTKRTRSYPHPILNRTGRLFGGTQVQVKGDRLIVTNDVPYAHFHQSGTRNMAQRLVVATKSQGLPETHREIVKRALMDQWKQNFRRKGIRTR